MKIVIITPGGAGQKGGMGSVVATLLSSWKRAHADLTARVIDPWPHEWKLGFSPLSLIYFVKALITLCWLRLRSEVDLVHIHMAGGGSVPRKSVFILLARLLGLKVILHSVAPRLYRRIRPPGRESRYHCQWR